MRQTPEPRAPRQVMLAAEFLILFILLPVVYAAGIFHVPKAAAIAGVAVYCLMTLRSNGGIELKREMNFPCMRRVLPGILLRSALVGVGALAVTWLFSPDWLFGFPRQKPLWWLVVMVLYPLLSALPQEFIYRTFMARRYSPLFGASTLLVSAVAFGFLHIVYLNAVAVALSLIAGWLFARVYEKTESLAAVATEHALYGCIIFTIGLGRFFYSGPAS